MGKGKKTSLDSTLRLLGDWLGPRTVIFRFHLSSLFTNHQSTQNSYTGMWSDGRTSTLSFRAALPAPAPRSLALCSLGGHPRGHGTRAVVLG
jgi:hypothetical protein